MPSPFVNIFAVFHGNPAVVALVDDRIEMVDLDDSTELPALVASVYYDKPVELLGGTSLATETRFIVESYGRTSAECTAVSEAAYNAVIGFTEGEYRFLSDDVDINDRGAQGDVYRNRRGYVLHQWG